MTWEQTADGADAKVFVRRVEVDSNAFNKPDTAEISEVKGRLENQQVA